MPYVSKYGNAKGEHARTIIGDRPPRSAEPPRVPALNDGVGGVMGGLQELPAALGRSGDYILFIQSRRYRAFQSPFL